jgi:peptide-methionine (S)-S-oxide reductase
MSIMFINDQYLGPFQDSLEDISLGLGCFWGAEKKFWNQDGVYTTAVGYSGGYTENPSLPGGLLWP